MNLRNTEKDEEILLSPLLSTKHSPSVLASAPFQTIEPDLRNDDHDPCSPVLDRKRAQELKPKKSDFHQSLMIDSIMDFSVHSPPLRNLDSQVDQLGRGSVLGAKDKFEGFCSPERRLNQGGSLSLDSPEVIFKKIHLNSTAGYEKRVKSNLITTNVPHPVRKSSDFADASMNISSKRQNVGFSVNQASECKPPKNIVKQQDNKERGLSADDELNLAVENNSLHKSMKYAFFHVSKDIQDKVEAGSEKLYETPLFDEANVFPFSRCQFSMEMFNVNTSNNDNDTECISKSGIPISPILKTKSLNSEKRKRRSNNDENKTDQGRKSFIPQDDYSKRNLFADQARLNIIKTACNSSQKFDSRTFSFEPNESKTSDNVGPKISSTFSSFPSATHESSTMRAQSKNSTHLLSPTNSPSPFGEKCSHSAGAVSLSDCANISSARRRLGFHLSNTEKGRSKGIKSMHKLNLKKTNNLENQFSKFSQFCKLNTSLSTISPSNTPIPKSKMKKFNVNEEESSFRKGLNYSENNFNFDRSPSPILEPGINPESPTDISRDKFDLAESKEDSFKNHESLQDGEIKSSRYFIEDQLDDNSLSPCLHTPKYFATSTDFSKINSLSYNVPRKCVKNFKFGPNEAKGRGNQDFGEEYHDLNKTLSPVLEVRKTLVSVSNHNVTPCIVEEDHEDPHSVKIHDVTIKNMNDRNMLNERKILNDTILEKNQEKVDLSSQVTADVDDDMVILTGAISKSDQDSMTIEFSESSGTQRAKISDGNHPFDEELTAKTPNTPQQNLPLNDDDIYESGKKRKRRYKNGTLSARLNKLVNRVRSETRMWAHEQQNDFASSTAIDLVVDIVAYEMNKWLLKCRMISKPVTDDCSCVYFVILHPSAINNASVSPGIILRIFPKWQTLDLSSPKVTVIFNTTRVKFIQESSSALSSDFTPVVKKNVKVAEPCCSCPRVLQFRRSTFNKYCTIMEALLINSKKIEERCKKNLKIIGCRVMENSFYYVS